MKGKPEIIEKLNFLLADELTAVNQYFVHAEECGDWGYEVLHETIEKRSIGEMKHAEKLISRILFLEGTPTVDKLNKMHIADSVPGMLENDRKAEMEAIKNYNEAIKLASELLDNGTKELLDGILKDEEFHLDYIEEQLDQIEQMGLEHYLTTIK
ncbi:MAG TPA: bacterioferritin [Anaerolineaceae bacterium]|nr:bacterioferritin [Anaerolineaceae bacterium]